jgi:hypothetical protein
MAAVVSSDIPCAGTRVGMRQLNTADRALLALKVREFSRLPGTSDPQATPMYEYYPQLESFGYMMESYDVPRAGGVVRLELQEFCTSAERLAWAKPRGCRWDEWTCGRASGGANVGAG